jgi:glycosyltransferase involved in cell wall biosynthesis
VQPIKRILFLTDNFPPEVNAPASRTFEHAKEWVNSGVEVTILTSYPNFPRGELFEGYTQKFVEIERQHGMRVVRVATVMYPNSGFTLRIIDQLSYAFMAFLVGLFLKADIIVATSPQFFTAISGRLLSLVKFKPWIMEVRDIWPEAIASLGQLKKQGFLYKLLEAIELGLYASAKKVIVVTDSFKKDLDQKGVPSKKVIVHKNGVLLDNFTPCSKDEELVDLYPQFRGKFIIGYVGTHGMAHGLKFILECLSEISEKMPLIHFVFIGEGAEKYNLIRFAEKQGLNNVTFIPLVPKNQIRRYLSLIDVALVNLIKSDTYKAVIPSKIFEVASMQIPILLGLEGETKDIINEYKAGLCFEPENKTDFINQIKNILNKSNYSQYQQGCKRLAMAFDRQQIALQVLETIKTD